MDKEEASKLRDILKETKLKTRTEKYVVGFCEKLGQLMAENGYTCKTLAPIAEMSERTIRRMKCEDKYQPTKGMIISVCIAMKLGYDESLDLLKKSPFRLQETSPVDSMYLKILEYEGRYSVHDWNNILQDIGEKPLGCVRKPDGTK